MWAGKLPELLQLDPVPGPQRNDGTDGLSPFLVGCADHSRLSDYRMFVKDVLDLGRVDVLASTDDHVLQTVADSQESIRIHPTEVTGMKPAFRIDCLGRRLGVAPVTAHHVGSTRENLAFDSGLRDGLAVALNQSHLGKER